MNDTATDVAGFGEVGVVHQGLLNSRIVCERQPVGSQAPNRALK